MRCMARVRSKNRAARMRTIVLSIFPLSLRDNQVTAHRLGASWNERPTRPSAMAVKMNGMDSGLVSFSAMPNCATAKS
jgi:hypothetical protein